MLSINFNKFSEFYSSHIEPLLADLERERKKIINEFKLARLIFSSSIFVNILCFGILYLIIPLLPDNISSFLIMLGCMAGPAFVIYAGYKQNVAFEKKEKYIEKLKRRIYIRLFKSLELHYNLSPSSDFCNCQEAVVKHIPTKKKETYKIGFEDCISGVFKDIPFELADAKILECGYYYSNYSHKKEPYEANILNVLMLAVRINKSVKGETIIKSDNFKLFKINKEIIKLEDNEFNKRFKVLADSEVEARYIITPSFMERIKNFNKRRRDKTIIFFDSKCSETMNMFILTNTGKDNFEIPFNKSILNEKYYYNLLKELVDMLEIAVALKLEQNIGL